MKIKLFSGLSLLSLTTIVNANTELDKKVDELKKQGFNVKVEEIKQKVYSYDEFEKKKADENKRIIDEVLRLDNKLKQFNQVGSINKEIKNEANKKNSDIDRENERRTQENARLMKDWMERVRDIREENEANDEYVKSLNEKINDRNKKLKADYELELARIKKSQSELGTDYENQKRDITAINEKIKRENDERIRQVDSENAHRTDVYNKEKARIAREYSDAMSKYKSDKNRIESENAEILKNNKSAEEKFKADTEAYNSDLAENKRKKEEYLKKVEAAKVEDARKKEEYNKAKEEHDRIEAKNSGDIAKINAENEKIKARNAEKEAKYGEALEDYKKKLEKFNNTPDISDKYNNLPTVYEANGLKLVGAPNEAARKSLNYYSGYKLITNRNDLEFLNGPMGISADSEITNLSGGVHFRKEDPQGKVTWPAGTGYAGKTYWQYTLEDLHKGSSFTITNVGKTMSGKNINLRYTMLGDYVYDSNRKYIDSVRSKVIVDGNISYDQPNKRGSIGMSIVNMESFMANVEFVDDDGNPINLGVMSVNTDVDYAQALGLHFFGNNATSYNVTPNGVDLSRITIGEVEVLADYLNEAASGENSIPSKSFLSLGTGTGFTLGFFNNSNYFNGTIMEKYSKDNPGVMKDNILDKIRESDGLSRFYWKDNAAYFDIFGSASNVVEIIRKPEKPTEPKKPELEPLIPLPKTPSLPNLPTEPLEPTKVEEPKYKDPKEPIKPTPKSTKPLPIEPVKEKDPILKLITAAPGRPEVPTVPPSVVPNSNPKPIFEPNVPGDVLPEPKKPELLPLLPKVTIPTVSMNGTRGSIVVKKYIFEYLNTSQGIGAGLRKLNDKKASFGNSLTLRNLN